MPGLTNNYYRHNIDFGRIVTITVLPDELLTHRVCLFNIFKYKIILFVLLFSFSFFFVIFNELLTLNIGEYNVGH